MTENDTVNACYRDLGELYELQAVIDQARDLITGRLEVAGVALLDADRDAQRKIRCTKCYWVFDGFDEDPFRARFRTTCSWCEGTDYHSLWPSTLDDKIRELDERKTR